MQHGSKSSIVHLVNVTKFVDIIRIKSQRCAERWLKYIKKNAYIHFPTLKINNVQKGLWLVPCIECIAIIMILMCNKVIIRKEKCSIILHNNLEIKGICKFVSIEPLY